MLAAPGKSSWTQPVFEFQSIRRGKRCEEGPGHRVKGNILSKQVAQISFKRTNRTRKTVSKEIETFVLFFLLVKRKTLRVQYWLEGYK